MIVTPQLAEGATLAQLTDVVVAWLRDNGKFHLSAFDVTIMPDETARRDAAGAGAGAFLSVLEEAGAACSLGSADGSFTGEISISPPRVF